MIAISDPIKYIRLASDLRKLLFTRVSLEQSKQVITSRLQNRERNFLSLVNKCIYENVNSPYLPLLRLTGCEYGDIESLVSNDGIETTLHKLRLEGIYLTWEEFTGKQDVVRSGKHFKFKERDFDNAYDCTARALFKIYEFKNGRRIMLITPKQKEFLNDLRGEPFIFS